jgi:predicted Zn-dependent peptidase
MSLSRTLLDGGVRVLTEQVVGVRSATIGFWVGVGSRDEPSGLEGASHLLEHLLFKGTERHSARDIAEAFDAVGGEANAFATKEYTCLYARVLDDDLEMATRLLTDMLCNPAIRPDDLDSERRVVLEELALLEDTPEDLVHQAAAQALFGDHPLGREVMGSVGSVAGITPAPLKVFHSDNYLPSNLVVAAAGSVDHEAVCDWVSDIFEPSGGVEAREQRLPEAGSRTHAITKATEQAHIVICGLGYRREHRDRFAWGVLDNLLGGGMSSRLFQEVREKRGLAYSVYSYRNAYSEVGAWAVYAGTSVANAREVIKILNDELDGLIDGGVTEEELVRAKGHMRGASVLALEDPASRMSRLGKLELTGSEILSLDEIIERIDAVTRDEVSGVAKELLHDDNRVLAVVGPFTGEDFA